MNCPYCNSEMRWIDDIDLEDVSPENEKGIISTFECSNDKCNCYAEFCLKEGEE